MNPNPAIGIGTAAAIAVLGFVALASDSSRTEKPSAVDDDQYAEFMASETLDIQDLAEGAEIQRRFFNRITPPGTSWLQPMFPSVAPFDAANFDDSFLDDLMGEDKNSVAVYPLSLVLDPKTRETLVYNADGKLIAAIPADPFSRSWPEDADPARVTLQLDLLPAEDVEPYLYAESRIADSSMAKSKKTGGMALRSLGSSEFGFTGIRLTNGAMRITTSNGMDGAEIYSYTVLYTSSLVVATWTNDENVVVTDTNIVWTPISPPYSGIESAWECRTTNLLFTNGAAVWEDADVPSNALVRFYAAAQPVDTDEDGLTDGAEILLHRTDPGLSDTDGDGMPDGWEVTYGLNARSGLDSSLAGWWKFDDGEGTNALDSAMDGYHGALMGFSGETNGGWVAEGMLGGALSFDGLDDWVRIAQEPALLTGGPFTVSAWVWLDGGCTSDWPEVVSDYQASTFNGYCMGFDPNRAPYATVGASGWIQDTNEAADRWVWLVLEYDGAQMRLYRDGEQIGSPTAANFLCATNGYFSIGNGQDSAFSEHWKGFIDDVRIYRSALGTNGLVGMYDAQEDPDGDGLNNLEECGIGSNIHGSNEVVFVYFVDSTNQAPEEKRSSGGGETAQYVTWNALQAKAASTVRFKEGYAEFTNAALPPSDPPKWYLSQEWGHQAAVNDDDDGIYRYSDSRCCLKEFDPAGWPSAPTNHQCIGEGHMYSYYMNPSFEDERGYDYIYCQPSVYFQYVDYWTLTYFNPYTSTTTWYTNTFDTCNMPNDAWMEVFSGTEMGYSNDWSSYGLDPGCYDMGWKTLTNEYTDALLWSCTTNDLGLMSNWESLAWGQRWVCETNRQTPYVETLPTNELCSIHLMATNHASLRVQNLRYRWGFPTVSGVVYRVFWWEKFIPANGGTGTSVVQRAADVLGTGGTVYTPAFDLPPPSAEGCTYPVPMESVLKVDLDGDNEDDGDVDDDDDAVEETLPVIVAINEDTRELTVRKVEVSSGGTLKIKKTSTGKITLKKPGGTTVLGENDAESVNLLPDAGTADLVLTLDGTAVGDVDLELEFASGSFTCSDPFKVKVVRSDVVQRSGNTFLAALIGEARTHSGVDWGKYVTDLYDPGIERISLATYESLADGGPDKKRLRVKKTLYMARRVWAKVYDNMDAQAYTLPTSAHPWNLFTTSTNFNTANCNELITEQFRRAITEVRGELTKPAQQTAFESTWYSGGAANTLTAGKHLVLFPGKSPMAGPTIFLMQTALNYRSKCVGATTQFHNDYEGEILIFFYNGTRYTAGSSCSICGAGTGYPSAPWYVIPFLELWDEAHHSTITPDSFVGSSFFEEITY